MVKIILENPIAIQKVVGRVTALGHLVKQPSENPQNAAYHMKQAILKPLKEKRYNSLF